METRTDNPSGVSTQSYSDIGKADATRQKDIGAEKSELPFNTASASVDTSGFARASQGLGKIEGEQGFLKGLFARNANLSSSSPAENVTEVRAHEMATEDGGARLLADREDQLAFEKYMETEAAKAAASGTVSDRTGEVDLKSLSDGEFLGLMRDDTGPDFWDDLG